MLWRTRDGRVLDVTEMSDTHLKNTIAYMRRRIDAMTQAENNMWGAYAMLQGEQAQYEAESCLDQASEDIDDARFSLRGLEAEQERRVDAQVS